MGQEGPSESEQNVIDLAEESRVYARGEDGQFIPISLTPGGQIETAIVTDDGQRLTDALESVGEDENRVRIYVEDGSGGIVPLATAPLDGSVDASTVAQVGYVARALNSQGLDEFVSRVTDSTGTQIDPLTTAVTSSVGNDEVRVASPNPLDVSAAEVDVDITSQTLAQLSADVEQIGGQAQSAVDVANKAEQLADALQSAFAADDQLRVDLQNNNAGTLPVEQQSPVGVEDSAGTQIDPATTALESALKSNDTDEFVARLVGSDGVEVQEEALDTAVSAADVGLLTYIARALNDVGQDELVSRLTDSAGAQVDPLAQRDLPVGSDSQGGVVERIQNDAEYVSAHRATGVTDTNQAFTLVLQNPGGSGEDFLVATAFTGGGQAHLDYAQDITIDTAGTALDYLPNNVMSGTTPALTAEVDGTYTINGTTLETIIPGSVVSGGNPARGGSREAVTGASILNPGDSVLYTVVNQSGSSADFAVDIAVSRV